MNEEKQSILGPIEWIALVLGIGILAYVTFTNAGYKVFERSVDVEFIDPAKSTKLKAPGKKKSSTEKRVDKMLADMAATFKRNSNGVGEEIKKESMQERWGLSEEEAGFYDRIRQNVGVDDRLKSATDWFQLLRSSQRTYSQVKNLVETLTPGQHKEANPAKILQDEASTEDFYAQLKDWYNISSSDLESFAAKGKNSLEDWATYLSLRNFRQN